MRLSLVIATRRRAASLQATLASLATCDPLPDEVIVIDGDEQASAAPIVTEAAAALGTPLRHVASPPGLTRQRNAGIREARGEVVVFADDDVEFSPGTFAALAAAYDAPGVVGATGRVEEDDPRRVGGGRSRARSLLGGPAPEGTMTRFGYPRRITDPAVPRDMEFMHGCLMSARRDAAEAVRFDERLPGYGLAEDEDFGYRLSRTGRVRYVPDACVVHHARGRGSAAQREFNRTLVVHRAYLLRKSFAPGRGTWLRFTGLIALLVTHRLANREWAGARGLLEGTVDVLRGRGPDA